jgi:hypothetical protein
LSKFHSTSIYIFHKSLRICYITVKILPDSQQTQEIQLWGEHGESFDEAAVLEKSKKEIVVAIFASFTIGSFKGY